MYTLSFRLPGLLTGVLSALLFSACVLADPPADAVWIDTRSPGEYAEGHLPGAVHIPFDAIDTGIQRLALDKDAPIYLYCGSGRRAEAARQTLEREGYTRVTNVGGLNDALEMTGAAPVH